MEGKLFNPGLSFFKDETNKMFVQFEFEKSLKNTQRPKLPSLLLKPCLYKKR